MLENDQVLLAHSPPETGVPLKYFAMEVTNGLKILQMHVYNLSKRSSLRNFTT